jgi:hypothetical protein
MVLLTPWMFNNPEQDMTAAPRDEQQIAEGWGQPRAIDCDAEGSAKENGPRLTLEPFNQVGEGGLEPSTSRM